MLLFLKKITDVIFLLFLFLFILRTFTINYEISKLHRENSSFFNIWYKLKTTNNCNKWYLRKHIWFKERYTHREQLLIDRQLNYFFSQKYLWRNLGHWFMLNNATVNECALMLALACNAMRTRKGFNFTCIQQTCSVSNFKTRPPMIFVLISAFLMLENKKHVSFT